jgi:glycosyltransferase involved in cell wall biosynthesis
MAPIGFSVVIPLFNKREFIRQTLLSALAQGHPRFEVIVVDDGSTDGGADCIQDLASNTVRVIRQENAGPGPARNRGAAEATFEWIALLDADDRWLPWHLSTLAAVIEHLPEADAVGSGFRRVPQADTAAMPERREGTGVIVDYFAEAAGREVLFTSCTAVRRTALLELGGFGAFFPGEDMEFWARLALRHKIATVPTVSALYVVGTGGLMEQSASKHATVERQPVFRTLEEALRDPGLAAMHPAIRGYRIALLKLFARQCLYHGDNRAARACLDQVPFAAAPLLHLLSLLPAALTMSGIRLFGTLKRVTGSRQPAA